MKRVFVLLLFFISIIQADIKKDKICHETKEKFKQINYLLNKFDETRGAFAIFKQSKINYYFNNPKTNYECIEKYKDKWLYLLYKNRQYYQLEKLYRTDKNNYFIPLYIGHLARDNKHIQKALEYYNKYITLKKDNIDKDVLKYIKSGGLRPYKSKWGKKLNPTGKIYRGKFKNIFFSLKNKKVFKRNYSKELKIQSIAKLFRHKTSDIGSYHVGKFYFDKNATYNISLETGHAKSCRIIIDNMLFSEKENFQKKYNFSKGFHKIEIELLNRASIYELSLDITIDQKRYSDKELKDIFKNQKFKLFLVNYQPSYRYSHNEEELQLKKETKSPEITIEDSSEPIVLILQSTTKVNWKIKNSQNIKGIVVGKHSNITDTLTTKNIPIYHSKSSFKAKDIIPKNCRCIGAGGIYLCNDSFLNVSDKIEKLFNKPLDGYTYTYKEKFTVPQEQVQVDRINRFKEKIYHDKKACKETQIDKVFKY